MRYSEQEAKIRRDAMRDEEFELLYGAGTANQMTGIEPLFPWNKDANLDIYRWDDASTKSWSTAKQGSHYALKVVGSGGSETRLSHKFSGNSDLSHWLTDGSWLAGRTFTVGCWVKSDGSRKVQLQYRDYQSSSWAYRDYAGNSSTVSSSWTWIEGTHTWNTGTTIYMGPFYIEVADGCTAYISQPMMVLGSSIGEGNYTRPPGEIVYLEAEVSDEMGTFSDTSITTRDLEIFTSGKIPKGAKAVQCTVTCRDSGSLGELTNCYIFLTGNSASEGSIALRLNGIANDAFSAMSGWVGCTSDGDIKYTIQATGSSTFDVAHNRFFAVQLR